MIHMGRSTLRPSRYHGRSTDFWLAHRTAMIEIQVPATSANLGPGFDALGLALQLYLRVKARPSRKTSLTIRGEGARELPRDESNLLLRAAQHAAGCCGSSLPPLHALVENQVPLERGLGSSAAAILAGVLLANSVLSAGLDEEEILSLAVELEGHPDNLAAALAGGLTVSCLNEQRRVLYAKSRIAPGIKAVVAVPGQKLSTEEARRALPDVYSREDAVFNLQRAALLVAALSNSRKRSRLSLPLVLPEAMRDRLHQRYRAPLVAGLAEALEIGPIPGLLGTAISGAGSSVIALADGNFKAIGEALRRAFARHNAGCRVFILEPDNRGATVVSRPRVTFR